MRAESVLWCGITIVILDPALISLEVPRTLVAQMSDTSVRIPCLLFKVGAVKCMLAAHLEVSEKLDDCSAHKLH